MVKMTSFIKHTGSSNMFQSDAIEKNLSDDLFFQTWFTINTVFTSLSYTRLVYKDLISGGFVATIFPPGSLSFVACDAKTYWKFFN